MAYILDMLIALSYLQPNGCARQCQDHARAAGLHSHVVDAAAEEIVICTAACMSKVE